MKGKEKAGTGLLAFVLLLALGRRAGFSQARQPPAYVLSSGDKVIIILGNVPRTLSGFTVMRKGPTGELLRRAH